jgi:hypothetical protein
MDKEEWRKTKKVIGARFITVYWWNMGTKTLDFSGSYAGLMKEKGIKVRLLRLGNGYRFTINLSSCRTVYVTHDMNYAQGCLEAFKIFYTLLGDRTIVSVSDREYKINWR